MFFIVQIQEHRNIISGNCQVFLVLFFLVQFFNMTPHCFSCCQAVFPFLVVRIWTENIFEIKFSISTNRNPLQNFHKFLGGDFHFLSGNSCCVCSCFFLPFPSSNLLQLASTFTPVTPQTFEPEFCVLHILVCIFQDRSFFLFHWLISVHRTFYLPV